MSDWGVGITGWNLLPETPEALDKAIAAAVRKAAFDIQAAAMRNAPVDTGFLKNSIYTVTSKSSGYGTAAASASGKNASAEMLPEVDKPPNERVAYIAVGAAYGIYVEFGTQSMPAQPYLVPAAELVRPSYLKALREIEGPLLSFLGGGGNVSTSVEGE